MKKELITVIMQAWYGNRTATYIKEENIDSIILGCDDPKYLTQSDKIDRTIIRIPNSECVIIYNKYQEAKELERIKEYFEKDGYVAKPLAFIPEENIEIYSSCLVCRMDESGKLSSLQQEDNIIFNYLAR